MSLVLNNDPRLKVGAKLQKRVAYVIVPDQEADEYNGFGTELRISLDSARSYLTNVPNWQDWEVTAEAPDPDAEVLKAIVTAVGWPMSNDNHALAQSILKTVREMEATA